MREKHPNEKYSAVERAGFHDKIVNDARRFCEQWGVAPLLVTVWFISSLGDVRGSAAQRTLSAHLARFVKQWCDEDPQEEEVSFVISDMILARGYKRWREEHPVPSNPDQVALAGHIKKWFDHHPQYENGCASLLQEDISNALHGIWRIHIHRPRVLLNSHVWKWNPGGVFVGPISIESLQARLNAKDEDYEEYRRHFTECWLIIVGAPCDPAKASDINLGESVKTFNYRSRFNRVFFLQLYYELLELELLHKDSSS